MAADHAAPPPQQPPSALSPPRSPQAMARPHRPSGTAPAGASDSGRKQLHATSATRLPAEHLPHGVAQPRRAPSAVLFSPSGQLANGDHDDQLDLRRGSSLYAKSVESLLQRRCGQGRVCCPCSFKSLFLLVRNEIGLGELVCPMQAGLSYHGADVCVVVRRSRLDDLIHQLHPLSLIGR